MARQWAMRDDPACNSSQRMTSRVRTDICWVLSLGMLINKSTYTRQPDLIRVGYIVSEVADVLEILVHPAEARAVARAVKIRLSDEFVPGLVDRQDLQLKELPVPEPIRLTLHRLVVPQDVGKDSRGFYD